MNIFIGCSSSEYISDKYLLDSKVFLEELFIRDNNLANKGKESYLKFQELQERTTNI